MINNLLKKCSDEQLKNEVLPQLINYATDTLIKIDFMPVGSYRSTEIINFMNRTYRHMADKLKNLVEENLLDGMLNDGPLWIRETHRNISIANGKTHVKVSIFDLFSTIRWIEKKLDQSEEQRFFWTVPEALPCVAEFSVTFPSYTLMRNTSEFASGVYAQDGMYDLMFGLRDCSISCGIPVTKKRVIECVSHSPNDYVPNIMCWFAASYMERMYDNCTVKLYSERTDPSEWGVSCPVRITIEKDGFIIPMVGQLQLDENPEHVILTT